jgi:hypothetical protein
VRHTVPKFHCACWIGHLQHLSDVGVGFCQVRFLLHRGSDKEK